MITRHRLIFEDASRMEPVEDASIDLVITSSPYPMIEMWEEQFIRQEPEIEGYLKRGDGRRAFERIRAHCRALIFRCRCIYRTAAYRALILFFSAAESYDKMKTLFHRHCYPLCFEKPGFSRAFYVNNSSYHTIPGKHD